jgi:threonine aldolase
MRQATTERAQRHQFASDNCSGICPEAWEAMAEANRGHAPAYGEDDWTLQASDLVREIFEINCEVFFTFNGTASNSLALASMCRSYHSIIAHQHAHVETDECGGPEFFSHGTKLLLVPGAHGKVDPAAVHQTVLRRSDIHYPKPRVLSITQATEMGTVYSVEELDAIAELTRRLNLGLHMDGARLANAIAALGVSPKEVTWKVGVDVLCFGGTKNGLACGDCVVFFRRDLAEEFAYQCKQAGQLASKMRFLAAPWVGILRSGAWLENARRANQSAKRLRDELEGIGGVELTHPVEANAVFVELAPAIVSGLRAGGWRFYDFIGEGSSRLMCSWDTTHEDISAFAQDVRRLARAAGYDLRPALAPDRRT